MDFYDIGLKVGKLDQVIAELKKLEGEFDRIASWRLIKQVRNLRKRTKLLGDMDRLIEELNAEGLVCLDDDNTRFVYKGGFKIYANRIESGEVAWR